MTFSFVDLDDNRYVHDREPDECPLCGRAVHPEEIAWSVVASRGGRDRALEIVYQCPRRECGRFFIAHYQRSNIPVETNFPDRKLGQFVLENCMPATPPQPFVPLEVESIAPSFKSIYGQAMAAEAFGLDQVAGGGYRKALEFLVKDYCISIKPESESQIKAAPLARCIKDYIDSREVGICAERAAWLGNDQLHYERKWESKDLQHLKELLTLTVNWIHNSILTRKYREEMK